MDWQTVVIGSLVLLNLVASIAVACNLSLSGGQRWLQVVLVWALPLFGAAVFLLIASIHRREARFDLSRPASSHGFGDESSMAEGPSICGCSGAGEGGD